MTGRIYHSDGNQFDFEREYYCQSCDDFRDVEDCGSDIVCCTCRFVIATFKEREIISNDGQQG